jgi:hypothetical protein
MIRTAARDADVHVMVPPLWRNTGIGPDQLTACADLDHVYWHILDGDNHHQLRTSAAGQPGVLALAQNIAADFTICRSADLVTPSHFPGIVRHLMEGAAPPFATPETWVHLASSLFDHGLLPLLSATDRATLDATFAPHWRALQAEPAMRRAAFMEQAGLPSDRKIIALPLEYEHEEMFFGQHNAYPDNIAMLDAVAHALPGDMLLAVTQHPLNDRPGGKGPLRRAIRAHGGKVQLIRRADMGGDITMLLARHGDGMVVGNSKSFGHCAFFGTPMLRLSQSATGGWMHASTDAAPFFAAVQSGSAVAPDTASAKSWFAFHLANNVFDPAAIDAAAIADRMARPVNPDRWPAALARFDALAPVRQAA